MLWTPFLFSGCWEWLVPIGMTGHLFGWPVPREGARRISEALASCLRTLGGHIETAVLVQSLDELPPSRLVLCHITPRQPLQIAGSSLASGFRRKQERYRDGLVPGFRDLILARHVMPPAMLERTMPISSEETSMEACRTDDNYSLTGAENLGKSGEGDSVSQSFLLIIPL